MWVCYIHLNLRDFWKSYKGLYVEKVLLPQAEESRNYLHISEKVMNEDSKVVLIMSNVLFFNWRY